MACLTASRPSLASFRVCMFMAFSALRFSVRFPSAKVRLVTSAVSWPISASSSSCFVSSAASSTLSFWESWKRYSRSFCALPSSSSQKPFFVASAVDSASSRSMSCWMRVLTFSKGSAARREAISDRGVLCRRWPSSRSSVATASCRALREEASSARARKPWLRTFADRPCKKDGGGAPSPLALCAPWMRTGRGAARKFTAASRLETLFFRIARAPLRASSSSARICERWSQSLARTSQRSVRSFRYSWSSFSKASPLTRSVLSEAIPPLSVEISVSRVCMAPAFA
mmetsp:Transcript_105245/g.335046  ORF Transcript_105245/g.335046 Transcript_105245/m.335046 type:complete len:286 (+) Transcript_105245:581-1438(+)